jgi:hypothetical protein
LYRPSNVTTFPRQIAVAVPPPPYSFASGAKRKRTHMIRRRVSDEAAINLGMH